MKKTLTLTLMATSFMALNAMATEHQEDPQTPVRLRQAFEGRPLEHTPGFDRLLAKHTQVSSPFTGEQRAKSEAAQSRAERLIKAAGKLKNDQLQADLEAEEQRLIRMRAMAEENRLRNAVLLREKEEAIARITDLTREKEALGAQLGESEERALGFSAEKERLETDIQRIQAESESQARELRQQSEALGDQIAQLRDALSQKTTAHELAQQRLDDEKEALRLAKEEGQQTAEELDRQRLALEEKEAELESQKSSNAEQQRLLVEKESVLSSVHADLEAVTESRKRNVERLQKEASDKEIAFLRSELERGQLQQLLDAKERTIKALQSIIEQTAESLPRGSSSAALGEGNVRVDDVEGDLF